MLSRQEIDTLRANIDKLSTAEQQEVLEAIEELERREHIKRCQDDFLEFCLHMDPEYKVGAHHRKLAALLMQMEDGVSDRLAVSVPPRHGKSMMISTLYPAWYLGKHPEQQIMLISHTADLAVDFGRKVRNIISSVKYGEIFPNVSLAADSKSAGRWNTNHGGQFYATGVGSALAGRGAHLCLAAGTKIQIDDNSKAVVGIEAATKGVKIRTISGWEVITKKSLTIHNEAVKINHTTTSSLDHPFMTQRGWVPAGELVVGDYLKTESIWSRLWTIINSLRNNLLAKRGKV